MLHYCRLLQEYLTFKILFDGVRKDAVSQERPAHRSNNEELLDATLSLAEVAHGIIEV